MKLIIESLCKTFSDPRRGEVEVLRGIDLQVQEGEFVSIVGASGCGKTTFLRIINGLIQPTSGRVLLDGKPLHQPTLACGFVFQRDSLYPWRTVEENIRFGIELHSAYTAEKKVNVHELIRLVGLEGFERHYPHELSGGMRQRVNLARALAVDPSVLLMDEPFSALDAQTRELMQGELLRIWEEKKKTVVFITHQIDEAVYLSDRVVVFSARPGQVRRDITVDIPRPRDLSTKRTPEFISYVDEIWKLIEVEVKQAMKLR